MKETHANIDELVRGQLNELPLAAASAAGWDALERSLDASGDEHLRNALTGLAATDAATGWLALERKLGTRTAADTGLAKQLNELQPKMPIGSWATLAETMDRETAEAVDVIVSDGLARTTPVVSSGWAALAARLELIGWRRSTVAAWKVTEGALLLSMILIFFRFGPEVPRPHGPVADLNEGFPLPMIDEVGALDDEAQTVMEEIARRTPRATITSFVLADQGATTSKTNRLSIPVVLPTMGPFEHQQNNEARTQVQGKVLINNGHNAYLPEVISGLEIRPLKTRVSIPSPMLSLPEIDNSVPMYTYLNGFVSPVDVNEVVTPGRTAGEYDISSERRYTTGFTAGGLLDINKGRNTLQVGLIYSRRSYLPAALNWRFQEDYTPLNPVEGYSKFVFHSIEFPFSYKFTISENDRWRISTRAGMILSVIAKPEIRDQEEVVANFESFENQLATEGLDGNRNFLPTGGPRSVRPPQTDYNSERELKDPPKGWLEGGGILTNSSFYLEGGFTVERIMNPRWSIYLSPTIGRAVYLRDSDGIGPYRDRINIGSLRMGSRYRFGRNK